MSTAAKLREAGKLGNNLLRCAGRDEVAGLVRKAYDGVSVSDINPLWVRSAGIKSDAEREVEAPGGEGRDLLRLAIGSDAAQDHDLVAMRVGQEDIAVGCRAHQPRLPEALRVHLHFESFGGHRPRTLGPRNNTRAVVHRLIRLRLRQVGESDLAAYAGMLLRVIGEGGLAGDDGARLRDQAARQCGGRARQHQCSSHRGGQFKHGISLLEV